MEKSARFILILAAVVVLLLSVFGVGSVGAQSGTGAERVVENGGTLFLGEEDIDTEAGAFENLAPSQFTSADGRTLSFSNGVVEPENAVSTYTATDPETGERLSVDVREARIQRVRPIRPGSGARLDFPGTPRVRPGENNLQFAVDYNYFESTEIDEELRNEGSEVTRIYLERSQDRANTGSRVRAADGTQYDAVFTFSITDTGDYEFVAEPLSGDDRPDGRDVGFDDTEAAVGSDVVFVGFARSQEDDEDDGTDGEDGDEEDGTDGEGDNEDGMEEEGDSEEDEMDGEAGEEEDEDDTDGEENGDATDGDEGADEEEDMDGDDEEGGNVTDGGGGVDGGEGNVTDGEDGEGEGDGMDGEEGEDGDETNGGDSEEDGNVANEDDGNGSEGLPGFTVVTGLLAIVTAIAVVAKRETEQ